MDALVISVHFLHVAAGAAWLGGSVFANFFLLPYTLRQPTERQRALIRTLLIGPERLMIGAALLVVVTGLVRGTLLGPISGPEALGRPYGLVWIASIVVIALVFATGGRLTGPAMRRLAQEDHLWENGSAAAASQRDALSRRLVIGFRAELAGILGVLGLMVMLRYL